MLTIFGNFHHKMVFFSTTNDMINISNFSYFCEIKKS
jgi:hypothetical protein